MKKFINSRTIFLTSLIFVVLLFYSLSYKFFLTNFFDIEKTQNEKHIHNLVNHLNINFESLQNISNIFAQNGFNIPHTENLNQLGFDFIVYENILKQKSFSKYVNDLENSIPDISSFENALLTNFPQTQTSHTIFMFDEKFFYLIKTKVNQEFNLYVGKRLDKNNLKQQFIDFEQLAVTQEKEIDVSSLKFSSKYLPNIEVQVKLSEKQIRNTLLFKDSLSNVLFSISTITQRHFVNEGKKTIHIVSIIMAVFLAIILYVIYKSQVVFRRMLQKDKKTLEIKVEQRTKQLEAVVKKVKSTNQQLHDLAHTDFLTKIDNRRSFFAKAQVILENAKNQKQSVCVCMIDIDNFKQINDTYGHDVGDKVLVSFTSVILDELEKETIFARLGGEEFAMVFPNSSIKEACKKIEKLRKLIENLVIQIDLTTTLKFTASFGISDNASSHNIDVILHQADKMLYCAKNDGKNTIRSRINYIPSKCDL